VGVPKASFRPPQRLSVSREAKGGPPGAQGFCNDRPWVGSRTLLAWQFTGDRRRMKFGFQSGALVHVRDSPEGGAPNGPSTITFLNKKATGKLVSITMPGNPYWEKSELGGGGGVLERV